MCAPVRAPSGLELFVRLLALKASLVALGDLSWPSPIWLISAKQVTSSDGSSRDTHLSLSASFLNCKAGISISESYGCHELM